VDTGEADLKSEEQQFLEENLNAQEQAAQATQRRIEICFILSNNFVNDQSKDLAEVPEFKLKASTPKRKLRIMKKILSEVVIFCRTKLPDQTLYEVPSSRSC